MADETAASVHPGFTVEIDASAHYDWVDAAESEEGELVETADGRVVRKILKQGAECAHCEDDFSTTTIGFVPGGIEREEAERVAAGKPARPFAMAVAAHIAEAGMLEHAPQDCWIDLRCNDSELEVALKAVFGLPRRDA